MEELKQGSKSGSLTAFFVIAIPLLLIIVAAYFLFNYNKLDCNWFHNGDSCETYADALSEGDEKDKSLASKYYRMACDNENDSACVKLGEKPTRKAPTHASDKLDEKDNREVGKKSGGLGDLFSKGKESIRDNIQKNLCQSLWEAAQDSLTDKDIPPRLRLTIAQSLVQNLPGYCPQKKEGKRIIKELKAKIDGRKEKPESESNQATTEEKNPPEETKPSVNKSESETKKRPLRLIGRKKAGRNKSKNSSKKKRTIKTRRRRKSQKDKSENN